MKRTSNKLFIYSLSSLAVIASSLASAETLVTAPTLEGGITASIGALYLSPSSADEDYVVHNTFTAEADHDTATQDIIEVNPGYDFGFEAALGYIFEDTANGIELSYRGISTSDDDSIISNDLEGKDFLSLPLLDFGAGSGEVAQASSSLDYDLDAVDLMISQFMDIGTHVQMRFSAGASYANLEKTQNSHYLFFLDDESLDFKTKSKFSGFGPRLAADSRYEFGPGFGLLGGASLAYFIGDLDTTDTVVAVTNEELKEFITATGELNDDIDNHGVTNLRANIGIDYVYFFANDEKSTLGIELGYLVDYYADAVQHLNYDNSSRRNKQDNRSVTYSDSDFNSVTFSGPYLEIKGAF